MIFEPDDVQDAPHDWFAGFGFAIACGLSVMVSGVVVFFAVKLIF